MLGTVIIPHQNSSSFRSRNLAFTVNYYLENLNDFLIIVTEQSRNGTCPVFVDDKYKDRFLHINNIVESNLFNKTVLINNAAKQSVGDVLIMIDNDCILPVDAIYNSCQILNKKEYSVVMPFTYINYLTESQTRQYVREQNFSQYNSSDIMPIKKYTGGVNIFLKSSFDIVGGFDNEIIGWGSEDDAFLCKMKRLVGKIYWNNTPTTLIHLWHPKSNTPEYLNSTPYLQNRKRSACIQRMSIDELNNYLVIKEIDSSALDKVVAYYESKGKLHIYCKVKVGSTILTIDSTTYPVTFNDKGEVEFENFCESFLKEGSVEELISTLNRLKSSICKLSEIETKILLKFVGENLLTNCEI